MDFITNSCSKVNGKLQDTQYEIDNLSHPTTQKPIYSSTDLQSSMISMNQHHSLSLNQKLEKASSIYHISNNSIDKVKKLVTTDIKYPMRYYENSTKLAFTAYLGSEKKKFRSRDIFSKFSNDSKPNSLQQKVFREKMPTKFNLTELKILLESKQEEIDNLKRENLNIALQLEELQHEKEKFGLSDEFIYKTAQKVKNRCNNVAKVSEPSSSIKSSYSQFSTKGSVFSWDMSSPKRFPSSSKQATKKNKSPFVNISSIPSLTQIQKSGSLSPTKDIDSTFEYDKRALVKAISPVGSIITKEVEKPNTLREIGSIGVWMIDSQKSISQNISPLKQMSNNKSLSPERTQSLPRSNKNIKSKPIRGIVCTPHDKPYGKVTILIFP